MDVNRNRGKAKAGSAAAQDVQQPPDSPQEGQDPKARFAVEGITVHSNYCRWFENRRVVSQRQQGSFKEELENRMSSSYNMILNKKKLPMSLNNHRKQARAHTIDTELFDDASCCDMKIYKKRRKKKKLLGI